MLVSFLLLAVLLSFKKMTQFVTDSVSALITTFDLGSVYKILFSMLSS